MAITAQDINKLRKMTGAGMMDCKKALVEAEGDFDLAIENLRKKGQKLSLKRADREASEGVVIAKTNDGNTKGIVVNLSCETDFVAKNEEFVGFAQSIADLALNQYPENLEALMALDYEGMSLADKVTEYIGKIGEKVEVSKYDRLDGEAVVPYIHAGYKIGVLVGLNKTFNDAIEAAGKDVAMQVAAMNPVALDKDNVPQDVIDKEIEIGKELARNEGKPEEMLEKIATGRLNKFFKENTLVNQAFVKDNKQTIKSFLNTVENELAVTDFKRVSVG